MEGLFASFDECRSKVLDAVYDQIDEEVVSTFISETIESIDEIATHHCIDEVCIEDLAVVAITHDVIKFMVSGSIGVELQWGSSSDFRRGDGAAIDKSFPFRVTMWSSVDDITSFEGVDYSIDTDSWWDGYYDDDEQ
ncbi:hypothetical protein TSO5_15955 [Azospirillum sp. TSO5]|nr:hypothetical protein TSO5_15955 [Azospirillum sp. TSO5]